MCMCLSNPTKWTIFVVVTAYPVQAMKQRYLEVTFRKGKPLAAHLHLPHATAAKAARTTDAGHGVRIDYDASDAVVGIEITSPSSITVNQLNAILIRLSVEPLTHEEWRPLAA